MAPIYIKGGLWTNVEDEIVKAAVMKYGLNQWSRVASLLTNKTAKQAKARWFEWLNPAINTDGWDRGEDEKLLSLFKLLPNQWRTISQVIGRTATSCADRYQKLIDDVVGTSDAMKDLGVAGPGIESQAPSGSSLNIHPEGLPAIPDELDDDQSEMLVEAKARLANTQGKKAKRKARERMLEESRSIALLQKRRELKAAGINVSLTLKNKKLKKEFDYNGDIPHRITPQQGLHDTEEEQHVAQVEKEQFNRQIQSSGKTLNVKKLDKKRKIDSKTSTVAIESAAQLYTENENETLLKKRKLELPEVSNNQQVTDIDQNIFDTARELVSKQQTKSSLLVSDDGKDNTETPVQMVKKEVSEDITKVKGILSKKSIMKLLKTKFNELTKPRHESGIILPAYDANEESVNLSVENHLDQGEKLRNLKILQEVEQERAKLRRSQVVQRGLEIPNPERLIKNDNLSGIDSLIAKEINNLIKSDYRKYVDPTYKAPLVEDLDEATFETVTKEINTALDTMNRDSKHEHIEYSLPQSFEVAETMIGKLHENHNASTQAYAKINKQMRSLYDKEQQLTDEITSKFNQQYELEHELIDTERAMKEEQKGTESNLNKMRDFVDEIVQAEHEIKDKLRTIQLRSVET
jgi:pre-mRNA-splicing factor CDC5/CEF1